MNEQDQKDKLIEDENQEPFDLIYDQLREIARARMRAEDASHTLQPTALVHEVWIRLGPTLEKQSLTTESYRRLFSKAMRNHLVSWARRKKAQKRGGGEAAYTLDTQALVQIEGTNEEIIERVDDALERLALEHPRTAEVVDLKFFGEFTDKQTGEVLGISERTVQREWEFAQAWLDRDLR